MRYELICAPAEAAYPAVMAGVFLRRGAAWRDGTNACARQMQKPAGMKPVIAVDGDYFNGEKMLPAPSLASNNTVSYWLIIKNHSIYHGIQFT